MPVAPLLLAAALALPALASGDPAARVCEMLVKAGLRAPGSFVRTGEPRVEGDHVTIAFSALDSRRRMVAERRTCTFRLHADGRFHVEPLRHALLEARLAEARDRLAHAAPGTAAMLAQSQIVDIGREFYVQDTRRRKAEHEAARAGIYPIAPERTALAAR